jgi:multidrug transporter EmrE-like cation transporter
MLILFSVTLSAFAQVALKLGMSSPSVQHAILRGQLLPAALAVVESPMVLIGLALYAGSTVVWLLVLSKVDVSYAYPFVALGIAVTAICGRLVFGDTFSTLKLAGIALIVLGVALLAKS